MGECSQSNEIISECSNLELGVCKWLVNSDELLQGKTDVLSFFFFSWAVFGIFTGDSFNTSPGNILSLVSSRSRDNCYIQCFKTLWVSAMAQL